MSDQDRDADQPQRQPIFNAPWQVLAVVALILGSYGVQLAIGDQAAVTWLAFTAHDLPAGRWWTPLTVMFVHAGWMSALFSSFWALAFAAPVARAFGGTLGGAVSFFAFYCACCVFSTLGYAAAHLNDPTVLVGATGAVSGLLGGASRLLRGGDAPARLFDPQVLTMAGGWFMFNLVLAVLSLTPFIGGRVPWEAQLAGYLAGLILIGLILPRRLEPDER